MHLAPVIGSSARYLASIPAAPRYARRAVRLSSGVLLLVALLYWSAFRRASLAIRPDFFAAIGAALLAVAAADVAFVLLDLRARRIGTLRALAALALLAGTLLAGGGGLLAWLSRVKGYVLLQELEAAPLASGGRVAEFEAGPLAPQDELGATVQLERLDLRSSGAGGVRSSSRLRIVDTRGTPVEVDVGEGTSSGFGALLLRQGTFGLAPRITVTRDGKPIFDESVPFTRKEVTGEVAFSGATTIHEEGLLVRGCVSIDPRELDGSHALLRVRLADGGDALGGAALEVGSSADLGKGYRVRFSGLRRWSEIEVSRRPRERALLAGALLALLGAVTWPVAAWKNW